MTDDLRAALLEWVESRARRKEWSGSVGMTAEQGYEAAVEEVTALWEQYGAALASPSPEPLEPERLARAFWTIAFQRPGEEWSDRHATDGDEWYGTPRDLAHDLAAEYARLSEDG